MGLTWLPNNPARLLSAVARPEWSQPSVFSPISIARRYRGTASAYFPYFDAVQSVVESNFSGNVENSNKGKEQSISKPRPTFERRCHGRTISP